MITANTLVGRIASTLAIAVVCATASPQQAIAQVVEGVQLPVPVLPVLTSDGEEREPCQCSDCAGPQPLFPRWHNEVVPYMQDYFWGYPENFAAEPFGASVFSHFKTQVDNATVAKLFLYRYDFQTGLGQDHRKLSSYGKRRLDKLAVLLTRVPAPLRIERTGNAELDEARRQEVLNVLLEIIPNQVNLEQVVLSEPAYPHLRGTEALMIYGNMLKQTQSGASGSGGGSGTSFGAPPLTGGGSGGGGSPGN